MKPWIGVDFDGTLVTHCFPAIGAPCWPMIDRVKIFLNEGMDVKIFTAQVSRDGEFGTADQRRKIIQDWCETVGLPRLEVTAVKDFYMIALYDDRAIPVIKNTGQIGFQFTYEHANVHKIKKVLEDMREVTELHTKQEILFMIEAWQRLLLGVDDGVGVTSN